MKTFLLFLLSFAFIPSAVAFEDRTPLVVAGYQMCQLEQIRLELKKKGEFTKKDEDDINTMQTLLIMNVQNKYPTALATEIAEGISLSALACVYTIQQLKKKPTTAN